MLDQRCISQHLTPVEATPASSTGAASPATPDCNAQHCHPAKTFTQILFT